LKAAIRLKLYLAVPGLLLTLLFLYQKDWQYFPFGVCEASRMLAYILNGVLDF